MFWIADGRPVPAGVKKSVWGECRVAAGGRSGGRGGTMTKSKLYKIEA